MNEFNLGNRNEGADAMSATSPHLRNADSLEQTR